MWMLIGLTAFFASIVNLVYAIICVFKKNGQAKKRFMIMAASFVVFVTAATLDSTPVETDKKAAASVQSEDEDDNDALEKSNEPEPKEPEITEEEKAELARIQAEKEAEKAKAKAEKERQKMIESQFSIWDGSHMNLTALIKDAMNDPKSYDHDETIYWDRGDYLVVQTTFRGKNAFGGVVKNTVKAKVALDGTVLEILEQY